MLTNPKRLNVGCGDIYKDGYVNLDWNTEVRADVFHDLNAIPYPFPDGSFDEIFASHILEHLDKPFRVMREFHRLLSPGGIAHIKVPHFSRGFTHAEHCHGFDISFPKYFDRAFTKSGYFGVPFSLEKMELHWLAFFHLLPHYGYAPAVVAVLKALNSILSFLANLSPNFCSRIWCYWVGGFDEIEFRLRAVKPA